MSPNKQVYTDAAARRVYSFPMHAHPIISDAGSLVATMLILGIASLLLTLGAAAVAAWLQT